MIDIYRNHIKQGYRRNNLIRLQTNDKGSGCNGNGYRYKQPRKCFIWKMRDINNDIEDRKIRDFELQFS